MNPIDTQQYISEWLWWTLLRYAAITIIRTEEAIQAESLAKQEFILWRHKQNHSNLPWEPFSSLTGSSSGLHNPSFVCLPSSFLRPSAFHRSCMMRKYYISLEHYFVFAPVSSLSDSTDMAALTAVSQQRRIKREQEVTVKYSALLCHWKHGQGGDESGNQPLSVLYYFT